MSVRVFASILGLSALAVFAACSDDSSTSSTPAPDAGTTDAAADTGPVVVGSNEAKQTGRTVYATDTSAGVQSTVTVAGKSVTTDGNGSYEIAVPKDTPYSMTVTATDFYKLIEQEWIVKQDLNQGDTSMLPTAIANLLAGSLDRDTTKGLLVVSVRPQPPCTSEGGTTLTIDPPGAAKVAYVDGTTPDSSLTSVKAGSKFSAFFYNVEPNVTVNVIATSPTCNQVPFPIDVDGKTLTGNQKTEPGEVLSFLRVYLGPLK
jgi:hypothetical protein